jgi:hypothetical protein
MPMSAEVRVARVCASDDTDVAATAMLLQL